MFSQNTGNRISEDLDFNEISLKYHLYYELGSSMQNASKSPSLAGYQIASAIFKSCMLILLIDRKLLYTSSLYCS